MCREKAGGQDEMRMLRAMYAEGEERLRQAGIEEAGLDAWYLLEFVTGVDKAHYYMNPDRRMEQSVAQEYEKVVKLRTEHIPLQHITGVQEFMGLEFQVSGDVLIPRQDTEVLVEEALKLLEQEKVPKEKETVRMLDLCTGSGCILISILYYAAKEKYRYREPVQIFQKLLYALQKKIWICWKKPEIKVWQNFWKAICLNRWTEPLE